MDLLTANLRALQQAQRGFTLPRSSSDRVRLADGMWRVFDGERGTAIHGRDPQREADRTVAELFGDSSPDMLVAIGLGLGFALDALERRNWMGRVLALEPEPGVLEPFLARRDWRAWLVDGRLRLLAGPNYAGASDCGSMFGDGAAEPAVLVNPALARLHPQAIAQARAVAAQVRQEARANATARRELGGRYLLNTLRNLPAVATEGDVSSLFGAAPGTPALVVAAGPSLDRALSSLRDAQRSAIIITVDTALRPLLAAGITPHVVVAVDPSEGNARHLTELPPYPDTVLVAEGSIDSLALAGFRGRTFVFSISDHQPWPWLRDHGHQGGRLRAWGSVLTSAFNLALRMHCDPIVFVGADLAYTDGRPYARNVTYEQDWRGRAEWGEPIERQWARMIDGHPSLVEADVAGRDVRTAPHLVAFRNWLIEQMRSESERRFVNATGGGILHGDNLQQVAPDDLRSLLAGAGPVPADAVSRHHRPMPASRLLDAARTLLADSAKQVPKVEQIFGDWERFAPGTSRAQIMQALEAALTPHESPRLVERTAHGRIIHADFWLQPWVETVPLVPLRMPPERLEWAPTGARIFRFRTMAARLICCSIQPEDGGVAEDGRPLAVTRDLDGIGAGMYAVCRDEVHFRATDGSDPRANRRVYSVLVPPCVVELETLPIQEILNRHV